MSEPQTSYRSDRKRERPERAVPLTDEQARLLVAEGTFLPTDGSAHLRVWRRGSRLYVEAARTNEPKAA